MKAWNYPLLIALIINSFVDDFPTQNRSELTCGQSITQDTVLMEDLVCPPDSEYALIIEASNITLDLGGHTIAGHTPNTGVFAFNHSNITIRNGSIDGFLIGIFIIQSNHTIMENLTVRNLESSDPTELILGISILGSQDVSVRDSLFEFISVAHKEAVEIYESFVNVNNIEVRGGGAGVNFSFAGTCDPANRPSNGNVLNSQFYDVYIAGIEVACSSYAWIERNIFSAAPAVGIGVQGDAPFKGDVTGVTVKNNIFHDTMIGIEFRGILDSNILNNQVFDNQIWGIAMRQSLGCIIPESGWECFYSTANRIAENETWGNGMDLYHFPESRENTWEQNSCEIKDGLDIPECTPPAAALNINYTTGKPGSFFTFEGANFPASSTAAITVNGAILGAVPTDTTGDLLFLLSTELADEGYYTVTVSVNPSISVKFTLDSSHLTRLPAAVGPIFSVPAGTASIGTFFPLVIR